MSFYSGVRSIIIMINSTQKFTKLFPDASVRGVNPRPQFDWTDVSILVEGSLPAGVVWKDPMGMKMAELVALHNYLENEAEALQFKVVGRR